MSGRALDYGSLQSLSQVLTCCAMQHRVARCCVSQCDHKTPQYGITRLSRIWSSIVSIRSTVMFVQIIHSLRHFAVCSSLICFLRPGHGSYLPASFSVISLLALLRMSCTIVFPASAPLFKQLRTCYLIIVSFFAQSEHCIELRD